MRCAKCNAEVKPGNRFCEECGSPIAAPSTSALISGSEPAKAKPDRVWCPNCQAEIKPGNRFCEACGTVAPGVAPPAPVMPPAVEETPPGLISRVEPVFTPPPSQQAPVSGVPQAKPVRNNNVAIAVTLGLLLILGGVGGYWAYRRFQPPQPQETASVTPPADTVIPPAQEAPPPQEPAAQPQEETPPQETPPPQSAAPPRIEPVPAAPPPAPPREEPPPQRPSRIRTEPPPAPVRTEPPAPRQQPVVPPAQPAETVPTPRQQVTPPQQQVTPPDSPAKPVERPKRIELMRPDPTQRPEQAVVPPPKPEYNGPSEGNLIWSGQLEKGDTVTIQGGQASAGSLRGELPGLPVIVDLDTREFAIAEAPSPSNGWKKLVFRSRNKRHTVVTVKWSLLR